MTQTFVPLSPEARAIRLASEGIAHQPCPAPSCQVSRKAAQKTRRLGKSKLRHGAGVRMGQIVPALGECGVHPAARLQHEVGPRVVPPQQVAVQQAARATIQQLTGMLRTSTAPLRCATAMLAFKRATGASSGLPGLWMPRLVPLHRGFDRLRWATPILHQSPRSWRYRGKRAPAWLGPFGW